MKNRSVKRFIVTMAAAAMLVTGMPIGNIPMAVYAEEEAAEESAEEPSQEEPAEEEQEESSEETSLSAAEESAEAQLEEPAEDSVEETKEETAEEEDKEAEQDDEEIAKVENLDDEEDPDEENLDEGEESEEDQDLDEKENSDDEDKSKENSDENDLEDDEDLKEENRKKEKEKDDNEDEEEASDEEEDHIVSLRGIAKSGSETLGDVEISFDGNVASWEVPTYDFYTFEDVTYNGSVITAVENKEVENHLETQYQSGGDWISFEGESATLQFNYQKEVVKRSARVAEKEEEKFATELDAVSLGGVTIVASISEEAKLPEGTKLVASAVSGQSLSEALSKAASEMGMSSDDVYGTAYDISLRYEGETVQPKEPVEISITFENSIRLAIPDNAEIKKTAVVHIHDGNSETISGSVSLSGNAITGASFTTSSFSDFVLAAGVEAQAEELGDSIQKVDLATLSDNGGSLNVQLSKTENLERKSEEISGTLTFEIPKSIKDKMAKPYTATYQLPVTGNSMLEVSGSNFSGKIKGEDGITDQGEYVLDKDTGLLTMTFYEEFIENPNHQSVKGNFTFYARVREEAYESAESVDVRFPGIGSVTLKFATADVTGEKKITEIKNENGKLYAVYTLTLTADGPAKNVVVKDTLGKKQEDGTFSNTGVQTFRSSSIAFSGADGTKKTLTATLNSDRTSFELTISELKKGDSTLTYEAEIGGSSGEIRVLNNTALWNWDGHKNDEETNVSRTLNPVTITKTGSEFSSNTNLEAEWTVTINASEYTTAEEMGQGVYTDILPSKTSAPSSMANMEFLKETLVVTDTVSGKTLTQGTNYTLAESDGQFAIRFHYQTSTTPSYKITYKTKLIRAGEVIYNDSQFTNKGTFETKSGGKVTATGTAKYKISSGNGILEKKAVNTTYLPEGSVLPDTAEVEWKITFTASDDITTDLLIRDSFRSPASNFATMDYSTMKVTVAGTEISKGSAGKQYEYALRDTNKFRINIHLDKEHSLKKGEEVILTFTSIVDRTKLTAAQLNTNTNFWNGSVAQYGENGEYEYGEGDAIGKTTVRFDTSEVVKKGSEVTGSSDLIEWNIYANVKTKSDLSVGADLGGKDVTITEKIPERMEYVEGETIFFRGSSFNSTAWKADYVTDVEESYNAENNTVTFTFKNVGREAVLVRLRTRAKSEVLASEGTVYFENTAGYETGDLKKTVTSSAVTLSGSGLTKSGMVVDGEYAQYTIDINKEGLMLNNGEALTLTDQLIRDADNADGTFVLDSIQVVKMSGDSSVTLEPGNDVAVGSTYVRSYDDLSKTLTLKVEDGAWIRVTYQVRPVLPESSESEIEVQLKNEATLIGQTTIKTVDMRKLSFHNSAASISGDGKVILEKYDNDTFEIITGNPATYELHVLEYDGEKFVENEEKTEAVEGNEFGRITFEQEIAKDGLTAYYFTEKTAPTHYELDLTKYYLYLPNASQSEAKAQFESQFNLEENEYYQDLQVKRVGDSAFKVMVRVTKVWEDEENADGIRPESIEVKLYADGKEMGRAVLDAENDWTYSFKGLRKYSDEGEIVYTIDEVTVPTGYTKTIEGDRMKGFVITNEHPVTPKDEDPKDEDPKDEDPKDENPKDEDPKDEDPKDEDPKDEDPKDEDPKDEDPKDEDPKDEDPKDDTPSNDTPSNDTPSNDTPSNDTPSNDTTGGGTPEEGNNPPTVTRRPEAPRTSTPATEEPGIVLGAERELTIEEPVEAKAISEEPDGAVLGESRYVRTGDDSMMWLYGLIALSAAAGLVAWFGLDRKRKLK